jgi:hypothetical protein
VCRYNTVESLVSLDHLQKLFNIHTDKLLKQDELPEAWGRPTSQLPTAVS